MSEVYRFEVETIDGRPYALEDYRGDVLLVVNTASRCGFTPQFEGLEQLHRDLADRGLRVLGFPCNQFGGQDPGTDEQIHGFCRSHYGVSFPMHRKIDVNGRGAHPLFAHLKQAQPGLLGTTAIKWNFTKFLVDRSGRVVARFSPKTTPADLRRAVEAALGPC